MPVFVLYLGRIILSTQISSELQFSKRENIYCYVKFEKQILYLRPTIMRKYVKVIFMEDLY